MEEHNIKKLTVVKHNYLTKACYYLPIDERRLILTGISLVNPKEKMPDEIKITADFWAKLWHIDPKNAYKQLKDAKTNLYERSMRIRKLNAKNKYVTWDIRWVDAVAYEDGEGYIILSFSKKITPYLSDLKGYYDAHRLEEIRQFKSGHAIRLYELCMKHANSGWYRATVPQLKELFGVEKRKTYNRWADFNRYVLKVAMNEINSSSMINITMETEKKGRSIHLVTFFFGEKTQGEKMKINQFRLEGF